MPLQKHKLYIPTANICLALGDKWALDVITSIHKYTQELWAC